MSLVIVFLHLFLYEKFRERISKQYSCLTPCFQPIAGPVWRNGSCKL